MQPWLCCGLLFKFTLNGSCIHSLIKSPTASHSSPDYFMSRLLQSALHGVPLKTTRNLQLVRNAAVRVVIQRPQYTYVALLCELCDAIPYNMIHYTIYYNYTMYYTTLHYTSGFPDAIEDTGYQLQSPSQHKAYLFGQAPGQNPGDCEIQS